MKQIDNLTLNVLFRERVESEHEDSGELEALPELIITSVEPITKRSEVGSLSKHWQFESHRFFVTSDQLREFAETLHKYAQHVDEDLERLTGQPGSVQE